MSGKGCALPGNGGAARDARVISSREQTTGPSTALRLRLRVRSDDSKNASDHRHVSKLQVPRLPFDYVSGFARDDSQETNPRTLADPRAFRCGWLWLVLAAAGAAAARLAIVAAALSSGAAVCRTRALGAGGANALALGGGEGEGGGGNGQREGDHAECGLQFRFHFIFLKIGLGGARLRECARAAVVSRRNAQRGAL